MQTQTSPETIEGRRAEKAKDGSATAHLTLD